MKAPRRVEEIVLFLVLLVNTFLVVAVVYQATIIVKQNVLIKQLWNDCPAEHYDRR
jgi:hypothetical protein